MGIGPRGEWTAKKNKTKVDFPVSKDLDLSPWSIDPATGNHVYECYALIQHFGWR